MFDNKKLFWNNRRFKQAVEVRNLALCIFAVIVLAITWSGIKTMQNNYDLQKQIATLQQQDEVLRLENQNTALANEFYQTDQYLDLSARQNLGLAAPGEKVLLVPKSTAQKYVDQTIPSTKPAGSKNAPGKYVQNLEDWRDFLLGRKLFGN